MLTFFLTVTIALPGGPPVGMDYLAYDAAHQRVWVPAGNTGNVDVVDTATGKVTPIGGLPTAPHQRPGRPVTIWGPSSATVGDGVVWVGNRADHQVCAFDAATLAKKSCVKLPSMPDGVQWVGATRELWVTTPESGAITVAAADGKTAEIKLPGSPEGYALDGARGIFYTNLEDKDRTLAIDIKTRKVIADWPAGCGADGPRGLALDGKRRQLYVACTDGALVLDEKGKQLGRIKTGKGVDNLDYLAAKKLLYVASREDGQLTIAAAGDDGALKVVAQSPTAPGARNAVVDANGTAYVADSAGGRLIVVKAP
jgi:DNA-binding beta-propeller fold protein YncE